MPIYEFRCNTCGRTVSVFQRHVNTAVSARCNHCGGEDLTRLVSNFAFHRAAGSPIDGADFDEDALMAGVDENDPRSVARWARRMGDQLGEDMGPEFDEMLDRMEAGEMPEDADASGDDFDEE